MKPRRSIQIGDFVSGVHGFTLAACSLSPAIYRHISETVPGMSGEYDFSGALTGEVTYNPRTLTATLELSEGNRHHRQEVIGRMVNTLDGRKLEITLPDMPHHYLIGRVHIQPQYNDTAHAAVKIAAECDPYYYAKRDTIYTLKPAGTMTLAVLSNLGSKTVCPIITTNGACRFAGHIIEEAGTYQFDDFLLPHGEKQVIFSAMQPIEVRFTEGVL